MTTGALLYAFDGDICYTKFAVACASRIRKYLNIPVSLVTDAHFKDSVFDQVICVESQESCNRRWWADTEISTSWKNFGRSTAFDLSPYDKTLLLDVDYVVNSDNLKQLVENKNSFFAHKTVCSIHHPEVRQQTFGTKNVDMWWATVVIFDRSNFAQDIFSVWKMVENNYKYYSDFFGFDSLQFRNDFALSIALLVVNGGTIPDACNIPWPLLNVDPEVAVISESDKHKIVYASMEQTQKKYRQISTKNQDLHIMGKSYLEQVYAL